MYMSVDDQYFWGFILVFGTILSLVWIYIRESYEKKLYQEYNKGYRQALKDVRDKRVVFLD